MARVFAYLAMILASLDDACVVARSSYEGTHHFEDAEKYLGPLGLSGIPELTVKYKVGAWGRKVELEGSKSFLELDDVARQPTIEWEPLVSEETGHPAKFTLLMVDPDSPSRDIDTDGEQPGRSGPYIHWVGLNCGSSAESCYQAVPYEKPNPLSGTGKHRYIFLLFMQTKPPPTMDILLKYMNVPTRSSWDLKGFINAMSCCMEAVAMNFFYASAVGPPRQEALSEDELKERFVKEAIRQPGPVRMMTPAEQEGASMGAAASSSITQASGTGDRVRATPPPPAPIQPKKHGASVGGSSLGPGWDLAARPQHDEL